MYAFSCTSRSSPMSNPTQPAALLCLSLEQEGKEMGELLRQDSEVKWFSAWRISFLMSVVCWLTTSFQTGPFWKLSKKQAVFTLELFEQTVSNWSPFIILIFARFIRSAGNQTPKNKGAYLYQEKILLCKWRDSKQLRIVFKLWRTQLVGPTQESRRKTFPMWFPYIGSTWGMLTVITERLTISLQKEDRKSGGNPFFLFLGLCLSELLGAVQIPRKQDHPISIPFYGSWQLVRGHSLTFVFLLLTGLSIKRDELIGGRSSTSRPTNRPVDLQNVSNLNIW